MKHTTGRKPKARTIQAAGPGITRLPAAPSYLPTAGKAEWRKMGHLLQESGLLTVLDMAALGAYCLAHTHLLEAADELEKHGAVIKGRDGGLVKSPWTTIGNQALAQVVRLLGELGATPVSRNRIPRQETERRSRQVSVVDQPL